MDEPRPIRIKEEKCEEEEKPFLHEIEAGLLVSTEVSARTWRHLEEEFGLIARTLLHKKMTRHRVKLPRILSLEGVWPSLFRLLHYWYGDRLCLSSNDAIEAFLGGAWARRKSFDRDSYGVIDPPLIFLFKEKQEKVIIHLHYHVRNAAGTVQWPLQFNN